jgi:hypothetical protein
MMAESTNPWASNPLGDDPRTTLETFQQDITVDLVATERSKFQVCGIDEPLRTVLERNQHNDYDFLPVTEPIADGITTSDIIVGLLNIATLRGREVKGLVRDCEHMNRLSEQNLIGANASIVTFLRDADHRRCRLVVSGSEIVGLVSLSDLQKLPVRVALFGLVTGLEIIMSNVIRQQFESDREWMRALSETRREKIETEIKQARKDDAFVEPLLFTQFADKRTIIGHEPSLGSDAELFDRELKKIEALRNHLAHANNYASTPTLAAGTCETVRMIDKWSQRLAQLLKKPPTA